MDKKGLMFLNQNVINDPLGYIRDHYLANYAFKISDEILSKTEKQCLVNPLFTGEADIPAQKLYESMGYQRIGSFALILG